MTQHEILFYSRKRKIFLSGAFAMKIYKKMCPLALPGGRTHTGKLIGSVSKVLVANASSGDVSNYSNIICNT